MYTCINMKDTDDSYDISIEAANWCNLLDAYVSEDIKDKNKFIAILK